MFRFNFGSNRVLKKCGKRLLFTSGSVMLSISSFSLFQVQPAFAHHASGSRTPANFLEGFLSGIAHPIIGIDHAAFILAIGLLAALQKRGFWIPSAFILASIGGTFLHLDNFNLPASEFFVAASVLAIGVMLTLPRRPHTGLSIVLAGMAGVFHGYAYGESIIGAEMPPIVAYLVGFALIQTLIALLTYWVMKQSMNQSSETVPTVLRSAGFLFCGMGITLLSGLFLG